MADRMPEDMPDRMPEDMSDRMPEDLPVTKCINAMVGITRSKVFFLHPPWSWPILCCKTFDKICCVFVSSVGSCWLRLVCGLCLRHERDWLSSRVGGRWVSAWETSQGPQGLHSSNVAALVWTFEGQRCEQQHCLASGFASPEGDRRVEAPLPGAVPGGDWPPFRKGFRASWWQDSVHIVCRGQKASGFREATCQAAWSDEGLGTTCCWQLISNNTWPRPRKTFLKTSVYSKCCFILTLAVDSLSVHHWLKPTSLYILSNHTEENHVHTHPFQQIISIL